MTMPVLSARGFSLVEVTLALGIAGFCLLAVMGLLPLGLTSNQNSLEQTLAASVASQIFSDLRLAPTTPNAKSPRYGIVIPGAVSSGTTTSSGTTFQVTADGVPPSSSFPSDISRFQVNITFTDPPLPAGSQTALPPGQSAMVRILVTWPPSAAPASAAGAFEAVSALDRG